MFRIKATLFGILFIAAASANFAQRTTPVIRQIDHILIQSGDPKALFAFFADTLQLPVAWPVSENQGYISGGVGAGNVNLELFRYAEQKGGMGPGTPSARFAGLAFEPYPLADALRRLKSVGLSYSPPEETISTLPSGKQGVAWTTVGLTSVARPLMSMFLYEYSPVFLKVEVRRKQLGNRLTLINGGPIGLLEVEEVLIASKNLAEDRGIWARLIGKPTESGCYRAIAGPSIRLAGGNEDGIRGIILKVKSIDRAKKYLRKNKLLGDATADRISITPSKVQGLTISLTDK